MEVENSNEWMKKYQRDAAQAKIEARKDSWNPEMQQDVSRQWTELIAEVETNLSEDPMGPKGQELGAHWKKLVEGFTGGDPDLTQSVAKNVERPDQLAGARETAGRPVSDQARGVGVHREGARVGEGRRYSIIETCAEDTAVIPKVTPYASPDSLRPPRRGATRRPQPGLTPVALDENVPAVPMLVARRNPHRMFARRNFPTAGLPVVLIAVPPVIAADPNVFGARTCCSLFV